MSNEQCPEVYVPKSYKHSTSSEKIKILEVQNNFNLSTADCRKLLASENWNLEKVLQDLMEKEKMAILMKAYPYLPVKKISEHLKLNRYDLDATTFHLEEMIKLNVRLLSDFFPQLSASEIKETLISNGWNIVAARLKIAREIGSKTGINLHLLEDKFDFNQPIVVYWNSVGDHKPNKGDWIGLYRSAENFPKKYSDYVLIDPETSSYAFNSSLSSDTYQLRYLSSDYQILSVSKDFKIGPQFDLSTEIITNDLTDRKTIKVTSKQVFGKPTNVMWVGLFEKNKSNNEYITYQWLKEMMTFEIPHAGEWELRIFDRNSGSVDTQRHAFKIDGTDSLEIIPDGPHIILKYNLQTTDTGSIGLYFENETDLGNWRRRTSIKTGGKGELTISTPKTPGIYNGRLIVNNKAMVVTPSITLPV